MKAVPIAFSGLIVLLVLVILNSLYISRTTEKLADEIKEIKTDDLSLTAKELKRVYADFKKSEKFISITVSHDDLTNIEESFADIIGASEGGTAANVLTIKSRLEDALRHLGRLSGINLDSII